MFCRYGISVRLVRVTFRPRLQSILNSFIQFRVGVRIYAAPNSYVRGAGLFMLILCENFLTNCKACGRRGEGIIVPTTSCLQGMRIAVGYVARLWCIPIIYIVELAV